MLNEQLITVVSEALQALPEVRLRHIEADPHAMESGADFEIILEVRGHPLRLLIDEKKYAYPRDVIALARQLGSIQVRDKEIPSVPMVIAPALPQRSREILRSERLAYGDGSGSLYLTFEDALFYVDKPVLRAPMKKTLNIYKGKTAQVLHTLLAAPNRAWHIGELAQEAGVVPSTAHQVFQILEEQLWVERLGKGPEVVRMLREPGALLNAWREEHSLKQYEFVSFYGWAKTPSALRHNISFALDETGSEYALTLSSGAELVAPFVTSVEKLSILASDTTPLKLLSSRLKLEPVNEGANVQFLMTKYKAPLLQRRRIHDTCVASDIQLYLDLWASPARGKEQAEHLRRERLLF